MASVSIGGSAIVVTTPVFDPVTIPVPPPAQIPAPAQGFIGVDEGTGQITIKMAGQDTTIGGGGPGPIDPGSIGPGTIGNPVVVDQDHGAVFFDLPVGQGAVIASPDGDRAAAVVDTGTAYGMVAVYPNAGGTPGAAVGVGRGGNNTIIGTGGAVGTPVTVDPTTGTVFLDLPVGQGAVHASPDRVAVVADNGTAYGMVAVYPNASGTPGVAVGAGQGGHNTIIGTGGLIGTPVTVDTDNGVVFVDLPVGQGAVHASPDHVAVVADNGTAYGMVAVYPNAGGTPGAAVGVGQGGDNTIIGTGGIIGTPVTADTNNGVVFFDLPVGQGVVIASPDGDRAAAVVDTGMAYGMVAVYPNAGGTPGAAVGVGQGGDNTIIGTGSLAGGGVPQVPSIPGLGLTSGNGADTVVAPGAAAMSPLSLGMTNSSILGAGALSTVDPFAVANGGGLVNLGADSMASSQLAGAFVQDPALHQLVAPAVVDTHAAAPATGSVLSLDDGLTTIQLQGIDHKGFGRS